MIVSPLCALSPPGAIKVKEPNEFDLMLVMEDLPVRYIGYKIRGTSFIFYINGLISYIGDMNTGNRATDYTPLGEYIRFIRFFQFTKLITCFPSTSFSDRA